MSSRQIDSHNKNECWSPELKLDAVIKSMSLNEEEYGKFLRQNGLYSGLVDQWEESILKSLKITSSRKNKTENIIMDVSKSTEYQNLQKELQRKEKALAEIVSLLVLKKS